MNPIDRALTDPWARDTPELLTQSLTHLVRASVSMPNGEEVALDLEGGNVSWDESRSPRVQATLSCKVPDDQAMLDRIDPRTGARVVIDAGYRRPDGSEDVQPLCNLGLRTRRVSRPDNVMTLEALSDEALVIDGSPVANGTVTAAATTLAMIAVINQVITPTIYQPNLSSGPAVSGVLHEDRWEVISDLADRIEAQVYDNGLRIWYFTPTPTISTAACALEVGAEGTIITSDTGLTRDDGFANCVVLSYEWTDGSNVDHKVIGIRRITDGPYVASVGNTRILKIVREVAATQTEANAAAAALVKRTVTRGRSFEVSAVSAYWLRPGHTVDVQLPLGGPEQHLVTAVNFDLLDGSMRVSTRLPDGNYTIGA